MHTFYFKSLFIFDDIMLEKSYSSVEDFHTGRRQNGSILFKSVRIIINSQGRLLYRPDKDILILFSQCKKDLQHT